MTTSERRERAHESVPAPAGPAGTTKPLSKAAVARALGVTVGPSLLLDTLSIGGTLAAATGWLLRPRIGLTRLARPVVALGAAFPWLYFPVLRP